MTLQKAISIRRSRRKYIDRSIDYAVLNKLKALIEEYKQSGLNIQLALNNGEAFKGFLKSYGMFSGVQNYIGLIEDKNDCHSLEKLGYYGELLVLHAATHGLGTCWVGGTFDRNSCLFTLSDDEKLACVIAVGNVSSDLSMKERLIHGLTHRKTKPIEEFYMATEAVPDWFLSGIKSVQRAPSAMNRQPVRFSFNQGVVTADVNDITVQGMALDFGIAKLHFELGAGEGKWKWGNGSEFLR